ncbi:hypothetical protein [Adhaeretor mobilis]|uniref:Uncharacterized protein n=1 Tax=Adhaeretor mobilis TaxID=1930276 RepID=A0A517MZ29_9BACT|nr:hypothetical protein [Adhaeretor mobilis]QDT00130.1 hypothetical protein HG15A2_34650 [Adhaeretor mobilis]
MNRRKTDPFRPSPLFWKLVLAAVLATLALTGRARATSCDCVTTCTHVVVVKPEPASWVFAPGRYTHDPDTGVRVAQYQRIRAIEPLDDPRAVTSGYDRSRTIQRGADGSVKTYYRVRSYGNGLGGLDAEWERAHDARRGAPVVPGFGFAAGYGAGYGGGGYGVPFYGGGYGFPGFGYYPGPGGGRAPIGRPAYGELDPDGANGFRDGVRPRTPDRQFYRNSPWHNRGGNLGPGS